MKKILLLFVLLFLLCGCSANVDIVVKENGIDETISITALEDNYLNKQQIKDSFREYMPAFAETEIVDTMPDQKESGVEYYSKSTTELSSGYIINYKYSYGLNDYVRAKSVKKSFASSAVIKDVNEKTLTLSTDNAGILLFKEYPNLTEIKVNIKASYPVKENNADSVNNDIYTWVFYPNTQKSIYILYDLNNQNNSSNPQGNGGNNYSSNQSNNQGGITITKDDSKKNQTKFSKFVNENPILVAICALGLFFIFVIILSKFIKR